MPSHVSRIIAFTLICCESSCILVLEVELWIAFLASFLVVILPPTICEIMVGGLPFIRNMQYNIQPS